MQVPINSDFEKLEKRDTDTGRIPTEVFLRKF